MLTTFISKNALEKRQLINKYLSLILLVLAAKLPREARNITTMGTFLISKRFNGEYKFIFATRRGKTIFTSIGCKYISDSEQIIDAIKSNLLLFAFTKIRTAAGKYFFRLSKDGLVLATSRKYSTELMLQAGIDEIVKYVSHAEILDFSDNEFVFEDLEQM